MSKKALDLFGQLLINNIRDKAIFEWDMIIKGEMKDIETQKVQQVLSDLTKKEIDIISWLIPQIVDTTIHHLLWTLEQNKSIDVAVKMESESTSSIKEVSDGLTGDFYEWRMRFSKERYEDI